MLPECHYSRCSLRWKAVINRKWNGCTVNRELRWIWDKVMNTARAAWQRGEVRYSTAMAGLQGSKVPPPLQQTKRKWSWQRVGGHSTFFKNWRASWPWSWLTVCQLPLHGNSVCLLSEPPAGSAVGHCSRDYKSWVNGEIQRIVFGAGQWDRVWLWGCDVAHSDIRMIWHVSK